MYESRLTDSPLQKRKLCTHFTSSWSCFSASRCQLTAAIYYHTIKSYKALSSRFGRLLTNTLRLLISQTFGRGFSIFYVSGSSALSSESRGNAWKRGHVPVQSLMWAPFLGTQSRKYNSTAVTALRSQLQYECQGIHLKIHCNTKPTKAAISVPPNLTWIPVILWKRLHKGVIYFFIILGKNSHIFGAVAMFSVIALTPAVCCQVPD